VDILKIILKNTENKINENRNGIYVNMSFLSVSTVDAIEVYLKYVEDQQRTIEIFEKQQEEIKKPRVLDQTRQDPTNEFVKHIKTTCNYI
jgi:hypothetical protein